MINGPLLKNMILFAVPVMLSSLLQMLFNAADTIVVGRFSGQLALAAVGATGSIVFFLSSLFNGLSAGANVVTARMIGAGNRDEVAKAVHCMAYLAVAAGVLLTVIGVSGASFMLRMVHTPDNIIGLSTLYMRIYFLGALPLMVYNIGAAVLRSKGDTKHATFYFSVSGLMNVLLNLLFVIVLKMSVAGVACATVISETYAAVMVVRTLMKEKDETQLHLNRIAPDGALIKETLRIGIPAGLQGMMFSISNLVIQSGVNSFGSVVVAGNSAAGNLENFVYIGFGGFEQACMTFVSQNYGAGKIKNISRIMRTTLILTTVVAFGFGFTAWYFGEPLLGLYTTDPEVIAAGLIRMKYVCLWLFLNGVMDVPVCTLRGMGYSTSPTILMLVGITGIRLLWLFTYFPLHHTLEVLYFTFPMSWVFSCFLQFALYIRVMRKTVKTSA